MNAETDLRVFIGYDSRESIAYDVCKHSIERRTSTSISIDPLVQIALRANSLYTRPKDEKASTEFSLTRFLVPFLSEYKGWSLFCDCDFLWLCDIRKILTEANQNYAVMVVKHHYTPKSTFKMDGKEQYIYPKKNWSSMILWNCEHPSNQHLDLSVVNSAEPSYLHQFKWLADHEIGELDVSWNCLSGYYDLTQANAIHYTDGGPWFPKYSNCEGSDAWNAEHEHFTNTLKR